ncbi:hypothetical protein AB0N37_25460 [Streptomyces griseoincarnatus]
MTDDWLSKLALRYLGDANRWPEIYDANQAVIEAAARAHGRTSSDHGHWIYPGTILTVPGTTCPTPTVPPGTQEAPQTALEHFEEQLWTLTGLSRGRIQRLIAGPLRECVESVVLDRYITNPELRAAYEGGKLVLLLPSAQDDPDEQLRLLINALPSPIPFLPTGCILFKPTPAGEEGEVNPGG